MSLIEQVTQPQSEYCTIPLTKNQVAIVDAADYEWLSRFSWYATWCERSRNFYAVRSASRKQVGGRHQIYMHREILGLKRGDPREGDHREITRTLDNRRSNLRIGTRLQNKQNARTTWQNRTGFIGVGVHSQTGAAVAHISHQNKTLHIGCFRTLDAAAWARDKEAIRLRGEFARLNFSPEEHGINPS
jgi:hypothetical protein